MKFISTLLILVLASSVFASQNYLSPKQSPAVLQIISGNNQTATIHSTLEPFVVRIEQNGNPLADQIIRFSCTDNKISFAGKKEILQLTDEKGVACVSATLSKTAYIHHTILVTAPDHEATCEFSCASLPDKADSIRILSDLPKSGLPGQIMGELQFEVTDSFDNAIRNLPVLIQLVNGNCYIDNMPFAEKRTDENGRVNAVIQLGNRLVDSELCISAQEAEQTLTFSTIPMPGEPDLNLSTIVAESPGIPDGKTPLQITVNVRNELNLPLTGVPVHLTIQGKQATLFQYNERSNKQGQVTAEIVSEIPQIVIINAYVTEENYLIEKPALVEFSSTDVSINCVNCNTCTGTVGSCLPTPLMIRISLAGKNLANQHVTFQCSEPDASFGHSSELHTVTDSSGIARAFFRTGTIAGMQKVTAAADIAVDKSVCFHINALPGAIYTLLNKFSDTPIVFTNSQIPMPLGVTALDRFQNIVPGDTIYFSALDGGRIIGAQPVISNAAGEAFCQAAVGKHDGIYTFKAEASDTVLALIRVQGVNQNEPNAVNESKMLPEQAKLYANFPNPFNPATTIQYDVAQTDRVCIEIFNQMGQQVDRLVNTIQPPGSYSVTWQPTGLPSGIYLCRISIGQYTATQKMLLQK